MFELFANVCQQDYLSKLTYLAALTDKEAATVAKALVPFIMIAGPMKIAQFDNGNEFKGALGILLREYGVRIINGRPRWPQSQGLIENANKTVKIRLDKWMRTHNTDRWSQGLLEVSLSRLNA